VTDSPRNPWEQIPGEPARAHERFLTWLHLGGSRTNVAAAEVCGCSEALIRNHARAWDWKERARAYDAERLPKLSDRLREAVADDQRAALQAFRDSQQRTAEALNACAFLMLRLCVKSLKTYADASVPIPPATLANVAATAGRLLEQSGNAVGALLGLDELSAALGLDADDDRPAQPGSDPESVAALEEIVSDAEAVG
jgi:hypothetical protein